MKLDIGSGDRGKVAAEYIKLDKHDFSAAYPEGQFLQHDVKDPLPFEDGSIDGIWCHHMLEHLTHRHPDPERDIDFEIWTLNEFHRVLKVGGEAHIIVPWCKHPNNRRCPSHYRTYDQWNFEWYTYSFEAMSGEVIANKRHGRWGCRKNCIHDNTHIYAILVKLEEYP